MFVNFYEFKYLLLIAIILNCELNSRTYASTNNWKHIESLAEKHPYIVGLMNDTINCMCTGVIISERAILTSAHCVFPEPLYAAVGCAVIGRTSNRQNFFEIASTRTHEDYMFEVSDLNQNITRMHSNIAVAYTARPVLLHFTESAILGNYFESELKNKILSITGYGNLENSNTFVLQQQEYKQMACTNPKWYYCICGREYYGENDESYSTPFGEGSPVFYGDEVVGIAACPAGTLTLKGDIDYNVFTVITPYLSWITKTETELNQFRNNIIRSKSEGIHQFSICTSALVLYVIISVSI